MDNSDGSTHAKTIPMTVVGLAPGKRVLDRYVLLEKLGDGGMSEVWSAADGRVSKRKVAIKFLSLRGTQTEQDNLKQRFLSEADVMASLRSRNIVRILDQGVSTDGRLVIVMDHLDGLSLDRVIKTQAPLSVDETLRMLREVTEVLEEAHEQGLVHRDLKPANIFLERVSENHDQIRVLDFGIAKRLDGEQNVQTAFGQVVGTPEYMAPEQLSSQAQPESDLYALGVVAYECLTGRKPLRGAFGALLRLHAQGAMPPPMDPDLGVPHEVESLIESLLQKKPEHRVRSARELRLKVERIAAGRSGEEGARPRRRKASGGTGGAAPDWLVPAAATFLALGVIGLGVYFLFGQKTTTAVAAAGKLEVFVKPESEAERLQVDGDSSLPASTLASLRRGERVPLISGDYLVSFPSTERCKGTEVPVSVVKDQTASLHLALVCQPEPAAVENYRARKVSGRVRDVQALESDVARAAGVCATGPKLRVIFRGNGTLRARPAGAAACLSRELRSWNAVLERKVEVLAEKS
ncbi:MAG: serine/threonine-protein kinase [Myxococcota bacterium]